MKAIESRRPQEQHQRGGVIEARERGGHVLARDGEAHAQSDEADDDVHDVVLTGGLLSEALQRLDDLQVVGVDRKHRLPGVAGELLLPELLVERALHRQDALVVRVVALERHELHQRHLVIARLVEVLHLGQRQQVARARLRRRPVGATRADLLPAAPLGAVLVP